MVVLQSGIEQKGEAAVLGEKRRWAVATLRAQRLSNHYHRCNIMNVPFAFPIL